MIRTIDDGHEGIPKSDDTLVNSFPNLSAMRMVPEGNAVRCSKMQLLQHAV